MSKSFLLHLKVVEQLGECIDFRKRSMINTNHYIAMYCKEIGKRFGLSEAQVLRLTLDEIKEMFRGGKVPDAKKVCQRRKLTAYVYTYKNGWVVDDRFTGAKAQKILELTSHKAEGEIKGNVANAPVRKITGKVQVILDASQHIFEKGNILVTSMTRPEFVPLMRKASAIITDEGGLTCHAAIISRELGIPCIIGTRIATRALKSGDFVEIDCRSGVVRKVA
jgi:phosphohistidine swiveling domain-containing protein